MIKIVVLIALLIVVAVAIKLLEKFVRQKPRFEYDRKGFLLTSAEREC